MQLFYLTRKDIWIFINIPDDLWCFCCIVIVKYYNTWYIH